MVASEVGGRLGLFRVCFPTVLGRNDSPCFPATIGIGRLLTGLVGGAALLGILFLVRALWVYVRKRELARIVTDLPTVALFFTAVGMYLMANLIAHAATSQAISH